MRVTLTSSYPDVALGAMCSQKGLKGSNSNIRDAYLLLREIKFSEIRAQLQFVSPPEVDDPWPELRLPLKSFFHSVLPQLHKERPSCAPLLSKN